MNFYWGLRQFREAITDQYLTWLLLVEIKKTLEKVAVSDVLPLEVTF